MASRQMLSQNRLHHLEVLLTCERPAYLVAVMLLVVAPMASAQPSLSLSDAIQRARTHNPDAGSAAAAEREADARVTQARAARLPKVDASESWQRGDHPAFVFGSRLAQRQLTAADLGVDALAHPAATSDFRAAIAVEQPLFDRATSANVRAATIARDMAGTGRQLVDQDLASAVTEAFGRVLVATATVRSAAAAVESARGDRELTGNRRDAGQVTDADVLQLEVYLARTLERQVRSVSDERIARARLNQLMGEPLTAAFALDGAPPAIALDLSDPAALEREAVEHRPEVALARQQERMAAATVSAARAAFLPQVSAQLVWELNGDAWHPRSPAWVAGATARINLFRGFADRARVAEARALAARRVIESGKAETAVRLDVEIAIARLEAARASEAVGRAAADSARASQRIVRERYEAGLADAAMLLRSAEAVEEADALRTAALANVITATATLQRATGRS